MNQLERLSTICEELSEELHAADNILRNADRELSRAFPITYGVVSAPILAALEALERAQRLVGPFEPQNLPQKPGESPYGGISIEDEQAASDDDWIKLRQGEV